MGSACRSAEIQVAHEEEIEKSEKINKELSEVVKNRENLIKILLLGTGDSGKSTFFKQIRTLHQDTKTLNAEAKKFIKVLRQNAKLSMQKLVISCRDRNIKLPKSAEQLDNAISMEDPESLPLETAQMIVKLWNHKPIKEAYENRYDLRLHVPTNADYYFENVVKFSAVDFLPSIDDILMAKLKTTGVQEISFKSKGTDIVLVDVGGQRSERRKWLHCLDDVMAIIYITAMDDYDSMLEEDSSTNRLQESLELFSTVTSSTYFSDKGWILFLNKKDLFEEKIKIKPLDKYFSNISAEDGMDFEKSTNYLLGLYRKSFKGKTLQHHVTCALDTDQCEHVFNDVREFILFDLVDRFSL
jgi:GTPase SAR1 family protein